MRLLMLIVALLPSGALRLWSRDRSKMWPMLNEKKDYARDASFRKAAEQGSVIAQHALGVVYAEGHGVPQDFVLAHKWFSLSAAQDGDTTNRDIIATMMTPAQIAEAQRLAREWKPK